MPDVLVTAHTPTLGTGRAMRTYTIVRALLELGSSVDLVYQEFGAPAPGPELTALPTVRLIPVIAARGPSRAVSVSSACVRGAPWPVARGVSAELSATASSLARATATGRVIADGPIAAAALAPLARRRPVIYNAHNLESSFRHRLTDGRMGSQGSLRRFERRVLSTCAESWFPSAADVDAARALHPGARVRLVPNVVDAEALVPVDSPVRDGPILLVGDYTYEPNRDAARWLVESVMPRVWSRLPAARLELVGRGDPIRHDCDARILRTGFVADLDAAYRRAGCVAVPLLEGGGTPLKFVEALAYGLPIVATSRAAAGLDAQPGRHFLLADDAEAFATAIEEALTDPDAGLGAAGRELALRSYSISALAERIAR